MATKKVKAGCNPMLIIILVFSIAAAIIIGVTWNTPTSHSSHDLNGTVSLVGISQDSLADDVKAQNVVKASLATVVGVSTEEITLTKIGNRWRINAAEVTVAFRASMPGAKENARKRIHAITRASITQAIQDEATKHDVASMKSVSAAAGPAVSPTGLLKPKLPMSYTKNEYLLCFKDGADRCKSKGASQFNPGVTADRNQMLVVHRFLLTESERYQVSYYPNHPFQREVTVTRDSGDVLKYQLFQNHSTRLFCKASSDKQNADRQFVSKDPNSYSFLGNAEHSVRGSGVTKTVNRWRFSPVGSISDFGFGRMEYWEDADTRAPHRALTPDSQWLDSEFPDTDYRVGLTSTEVNKWRVDFLETGFKLGVVSDCDHKRTRLADGDDAPLGFGAGLDGISRKRRLQAAAAIGAMPAIAGAFSEAAREKYMAFKRVSASASGSDVSTADVDWWKDTSYQDYWGQVDGKFGSGLVPPLRRVQETKIQEERCRTAEIPNFMQSVLGGDMEVAACGGVAKCPAGTGSFGGYGSIDLTVTQKDEAKRLFPNFIRFVRTLSGEGKLSFGTYDSGSNTCSDWFWKGMLKVGYDLSTGICYDASVAVGFAGASFGMTLDLDLTVTPATGETVDVTAKAYVKGEAGVATGKKCTCKEGMFNGEASCGHWCFDWYSGCAKAIGLTMEGSVSGNFEISSCQGGTKATISVTAALTVHFVLIGIIDISVDKHEDLLSNTEAWNTCGGNVNPVPDPSPDPIPPPTPAPTLAPTPPNPCTGCSGATGACKNAGTNNCFQVDGGFCTPGMIPC
jgi:hypothetical protein